MSFSKHNGFILPTVLFLTAVGLLFGAGALLLFRYQCQLRIDRQHELEKVYAVRSVLNYIRPFECEIEDEGRAFRYHTASDRDLNVIVKPVSPIFPDATKRHLFTSLSGLQNGASLISGNRLFSFITGKYDPLLDFEYGADYGPSQDIAANCIKAVYTGANAIDYYGLAFSDLDASNYEVNGITNNVKWWVNIGMSETGGWMQEDYGRRYFFRLKDYVGSSNADKTKDIIRLCLISTNTINQTEGRRYGWPLSRPGERALVFQIEPLQEDYASVTLSDWEYVGGEGLIKKTCLLSNANFRQPTKVPSLGYMGLQLSRDMVSLFYIETGMNEDMENDFHLPSRAYTFSAVTNLPYATYAYFARYYDSAEGSWRIYDPEKFGPDGKRLDAPGQRAVFEVEAASTLRLDQAAKTAAMTSFNYDSLTDFRVTPAYQYNVFLEHPATVTNLATVTQKIGKYVSLWDQRFTVLTYDTHGTEHKGFRYDEKQARENQ